MFVKKSLIIPFALSFLLMACEGAQSEKDMIAEAQFCLDEATDAASADACLSKISSLDSEQANTLRCAGGFIAAEITSPANLSKALNAIKDGDGTVVLLSSLSFPNINLVNQTVDSCNKSGQSGLKLIGAMAKSATTIASVANLASCENPGDLTSCNAAVIEDSITNLLSAGTPEAEEALLQIAESIQTVYTSTCGEKVANEDICGQIEEASQTSGVDISNASEAQLRELGKALLQEWKK